MPNIAQQDYIIIDWGGKDADDAAKKAEVDAQLKNIYLANPLALLSVLFKDYEVEGSYAPVISFTGDDIGGSVDLGVGQTDTVMFYTFDTF